MEIELLAILKLQLLLTEISEANAARAWLGTLRLRKVQKRFQRFKGEFLEDVWSVFWTMF